MRMLALPLFMPGVVLSTTNLVCSFILPTKSSIEPYQASVLIEKALRRYEHLPGAVGKLALLLVASSSSTPLAIYRLWLTT